MATVLLPTEWLDQAWGGTVKQDLLPVVAIHGDQLKITIFPNGGAGMRVITRSIPKTGQVTFNVTEGMRAFVRLLKDFPQITLDIQGDRMAVTAETSCSAVQYHFPNVELVDDNVIPDHAKDVELVVPTAYWHSLWKSLPSKGTCELSCNKSRRSVTLKHSKGRWAGAIQAREKPQDSRTFTADALVARRIFRFVQPSATFSTLVFMDCGVLKWVHENTTVYIAPFE